jgi:hypothetical protein
MKVGLWIIGGLCVGYGLLHFIGGFGDPGFGLVSASGEVLPAAVSYSQFGYDASADVTLTSNGYRAIALFVGGIAMMVFANLKVTKEVQAH